MVQSDKAGGTTEKKRGPRLIYDTQKCAFDFVFSLLLSAILFFPMMAVALIIVMIDFGNPFYAQERVGQNGKKFAVLKFRSMKKGADNLEAMLSPQQIDEYRREFKLKDDPRLIGYRKPGDGNKCFGALLRRSSVDELPQIFWNVCVKRNMSLVGPRPILERELEEHYTPEEREIFLSAKPGLTGYWQAYARNSATYETGERQRMELYYIEHQSAFLDMKILLKTVSAVLKMDGAM